MNTNLTEIAANPPIRMVDRVVTIGGKRLRYSVSDNVDAPWWAVNVHGFFAGGGVYWRESTRLAAKLGVRVVNPNMPGFAGSTALAWDDLHMSSYADTLALLMDHLGIERALILGHSMGGAISAQFAHDYPERTLGLVYRDGVATSSWKARRGLLKAVLATVSPDLGDAADIAWGFLRDVPDMMAGRVSAWVSTASPDIRQNARKLLDTAPVAAMLLGTDLTPLVEDLRRMPEIPVLPMWGRFDRLVPPRTGEEFAEIVGRPLHWIWGGHSWMIPRPATTLHHLTSTPTGQAFLEEVTATAGVDMPVAV